MFMFSRFSLREILLGYVAMVESMLQANRAGTFPSIEKQVSKNLYFVPSAILNHSILFSQKSFFLL